MLTLLFRKLSLKVIGFGTTKQGFFGEKKTTATIDILQLKQGFSTGSRLERLKELAVFDIFNNNELIFYIHAETSPDLVTGSWDWLLQAPSKRSSGLHEKHFCHGSGSISLKKASIDRLRFRGTIIGEAITEIYNFLLSKESQVPLITKNVVIKVERMSKLPLRKTIFEKIKKLEEEIVAGGFSLRLDFNAGESTAESLAEPFPGKNNNNHNSMVPKSSNGEVKKKQMKKLSKMKKYMTDNVNKNFPFVDFLEKTQTLKSGLSKFFSDGGYRPGFKNPAGWAWVLLDENDEQIVCEMSGLVSIDQNNGLYLGAEKFSNNTAELTAVGEILRFLLAPHVKFENSLCRNIMIFTDSTYIIGALEGYQKVNENIALVNTVKNLLARAESSGFIIKFAKVKGHSGNEFNKRVDFLANDAITRVYAPPKFSLCIGGDVEQNS